MNHNSVDSLTAKALKFIGYRSRSEKEIRDYLAQKLRQEQGDKSTLINQIIQNIKQFNLLNDERFAVDWARAKLNSGKGTQLIRSQLLKKGITKEIIQQVFSQLEEEAILTAVRHAAEKYGSKLKEKPSFLRAQKLKKHLYSRGFSIAAINQVIDDKGQVRVE